MNNQVVRIAIVMLSLIAVSSYAQNKKTRAMLASIEGQYMLDDRGQLSYTEVVELPHLTKDEIYVRALDYFTYNYGDANEVLQTEDKESGRLVGKGIYDNVHTGWSIYTAEYDTWHIVQVDIKEGKARIIVTLTNYDITYIDANGFRRKLPAKPIVNAYPFTKTDMTKNFSGKAFYGSHKRALGTLVSLRDALQNGNTVAETEDNW